MKNRDELVDLDEQYNEVESNEKGVFNKFSIDSRSNDRTFCIAMIMI